MKITSAILENINNQLDKTTKKSKDIIANGIEDLIIDEKEAIKGYNQFLADISENLSEELYNKAKDIINHISEEEQEHIKELDSLYKELSNFIK